MDDWLAFALCLGPLTHYVYFVRGEHHLKAPLYFQILLVTAISFYFSPVRAFLLPAYLVSLFLSVTSYRLLFHPLRNFPGPRLAAVSKIWHSWRCRTSQNYRVLGEWKEKYGSFVRTGPNEITIFHPEALGAISRPQNGCTKSPWYDILLPHVAINTTRDQREHDARRAILLQTLLNYDASYMYVTSQVKDLIFQAGSQEMNIVDLIYHWSFDVMGDVIFSTPFQTLTHSHSHHHIHTLRRFLSFLGPFSPTPWLLILRASLPLVADGWHQMFKTFETCLAERKKVFDHTTPIGPDLHALTGDAVALVIAGSDTAASTLVYALFYLAKEPRYQDILLNELKQGNISEPSASNVQSLPILNAVINETLRLHSPVPTGTPRDTGANGLTVAGRYIPPHTTIVAPRHNISRLSICFSNALEFDPMRWVDAEKREGPHDLRAFSPFGTGVYSCIGRGLAMRQMRAFIANIVSSFQFELAEGEDGIAVERDMRDESTALPGKLWLKFSSRKRDT
ncbi:cytochrome P450 [Xylariaceae sp. FL1651]|nr:cytochrome P450 [Xylariaceae sp. FL1651]